MFQYIRFAPEIDLDKIIDLLLQKWKLTLPEVLVSIIGDDEVTKSNSKLAAVVSNGLTQVRVVHFVLICCKNISEHNYLKVLRYSAICTQCSQSYIIQLINGGHLL